MSADRDPLAPARELTREETEALFALALPLYRPRSMDDFERSLNSPEPELRSLERRLLIQRITPIDEQRVRQASDALRPILSAIRREQQRAELEAETLRLAALDPLDYQLERSEAAEGLSIGVSALDQLVRRARASGPRKRFEHSNTRQPCPTGTGTFESSNGSAKTVDLNALYEVAKGIIEHPDPLALVEQAIIASGYAGDPTPCLLAYLAVTSRLLDRPQNVQFLAQSASGKNFTVDTALHFFPADAFYKLTASSERALIYTSETFCHRIVVLEECDSIPAKGPAASAIRSLVHDARMIYETVEKDETGQFQTRRIEKEGPTGLITTGVRALDAQMATRLLTCPLLDSPAQTRAVMAAQARAAQGQTAALPEAEIEKLRAYQRWLAASGSRTVIPFASVLGDMLPAKAVRTRRDFLQLLTVVRTLALLAQRSRHRSEDGAIEATLDDYGRARRIMAPLFDSVAAEGITRAVRETVEAVGRDEEVSETELARRLDLAKATISYRVRGAIRGGWIKNSETRRGYPARLSRGEPLPEQRSALPEVDEVRQRFEARPNTDSNTPEAVGAQGVDADAFDGSSEREDLDADDEDENAEIDRLARDDGWNPGLGD